MPGEELPGTMYLENRTFGVRWLEIIHSDVPEHSNPCGGIRSLGENVVTTPGNAKLKA